MKRVEIIYCPYKMDTKVLIDGKDVIGDTRNTSYTNFRNVIGADFKTPLQTWIEPIPYKGWKGLIEEIGDPERNSEIEIVFSGREIDFNDLKRALDNQNEKRNLRIRNRISYVHKKKIEDEQVAKDIDYVVEEMKSERFQRLVDERESLKKFYAELEENYKKTKEKEFDIVFAGLYSSGKSTLINTLIRHEILPVASETCTNMVYKIHHDNSLGNRVKMHFHDEKGTIKECIFDSDIECAECFEKISKRVKENAEENIGKEKRPLETRMDIYVDLSHLYPSAIKEKDFSIVLIDTPGMDSTESITSDGFNQHAQIALNAILMDNKPMIILCAEATKYEDKNIGEFMRSILLKANDEHGGFNDRFLFLLNKCDAVKFGNGESIGKAKERFSKYLTDAKKWGIALDDDEKEQLKNASYFVPRIFMVTARIANAIQNKIFKLSPEELRENENKRSLYNDLREYREEVNYWDNKNKYLLNYCDIPEYRKKEFEEEVRVAQNNEEDDIEATKIQCGIVAVESAIRDYIERYAYPIKLQELFRTFENILVDVKEWNDETLEKLKNCEKKREEKENEKNYELEENAGKKEEEKKLQIARERVESYNNDLEQIDSGDCLEELRKIINKFEKNISAKPQIREVTEKNFIETYGKTEYEIRIEISNKINEINDIYLKELDNIEMEMRQVEQKYDDKMKMILEGLNSIIIELKESGVFGNRKYDFTNSIWWKMQLTNRVIDPKLVDKMNIKKREDIEKEVVNEKKQKYTSWMPENWIRKGIERIFKIVEIKPEIIPGHYETKEIVATIRNYNKNLDQMAKKLAENLTENLDKKKGENIRLLDDMISALKDFHKDINIREEKINSLKAQKEKLESEIRRYKDDNLWLDGLYKKIERIMAYE